MGRLKIRGELNAKYEEGVCRTAQIQDNCLFGGTKLCKMAPNIFTIIFEVLFPYIQNCVIGLRTEQKLQLTVSFSGHSRTAGPRYATRLMSPFEHQEFGGIIIKWILRKWEGVVGIGWGWLRIGTVGGRL